MIRELLSRVLRSDVDSGIHWSEIESKEVLARQTVEQPSAFGRTDTLEIVLCSKGDRFILFNKWRRSGLLQRIEFSRNLDGTEMRLSELRPAPDSLYRLQLSPVAGAPVLSDASHPIWFGLWRNEPTAHGLGAGICFIDSADRESLATLRSRLLDGNVPESLLTEEAMWQRMNKLPEQERRSAIAALAMQQHAELQRKFEEMHPDLGPVPDELRAMDEHLQQQLEKIRRTAASKPVDAELADLMQRFQKDVMNQSSPNENRGEQDK